LRPGSGSLGRGHVTHVFSSEDETSSSESELIAQVVTSVARLISLAQRAMVRSSVYDHIGGANEFDYPVPVVNLIT
jgi:hypothetical protein